MNGVLYLAVVVAAFGSGLAQTHPPPDPCRTCQILINIAYHHFNNTVNDKQGLLTQLQMECQRLAQFEGAQASADCTRIVNANIDTIYNDLNTQKSPQQTCMDIKECPAPTGRASVLKRQKRQQPQHTPCSTCQIIISIAKRHFNNQFTDQNALKAQLDMECQALAQHGYTQTEATNCQNLIDANMNAIFMELQNNPTASPQKICQDLGQCTMVKRQKRQRPADPCRTCQIIINIAQHHFNNNVNDKNALQQELLMECQRLAQFEGQAASQHCTQIVTANINTIFADMSTSKTAQQTCQDIKECQ